MPTHRHSTAGATAKPNGRSNGLDPTDENVLSKSAPIRDKNTFSHLRCASRCAYRKYVVTLKKKKALAGWLSWLEHHSKHQKVAGLILSQGTYLGCGFNLWLGHIEEGTNQYFKIWR